ncbi:MAG: ABC transporter ATP-binding protein [Planctomycetota bacterium]|jgi:ABC-2 type transport system ATP-binding protein
MSDPVIELGTLKKRFGRVRAVDGVDLTVDRGEIFGLLGPNGAGKTTILRLLTGLLRPTSGTIRVFGRDPRADALFTSSRSGAMIEGPGLHPNLSGRRNLELFGRLRGISDPELAGAVDRGLELAELGSASERRFHTYSTGMKQKVGIAVAMMGDPELVILDEPTSGLDPASVVNLREILVDRNRTKGVTLLLSSHHLSEMETLCTRVAILSKGTVLAEGAPADLVPKGATLYRVEVDDAEKALELSAGSEWEAKALSPGGGLEVRLRPGDVPAFLRGLLEGGVEVSEIRTTRSRLEEAYMRFTGDGPETERADADGEGGNP